MKTAPKQAAVNGPRNGGHNSPTPDETMRAIVRYAYGTTDVRRLDQVPRPRIAESEVLIRVRAAGLDRGTWHLMTGRPYLLRLFGFGLVQPKEPVAGIDVAGTVAAVGSAVTRLAVGDKVFGIARGSFAEYAPAVAAKLAPMPANLTFEQAAVVPVSALTALQAVSDVGRVRPGQRVLITGASGGVGSYAVQLAKAFGAEVTAVCGTSKLDFVRSLGADHVVDYTRDDFADGRNHYDVILDIAGNPRLSRLRRALTTTGTAVIVGGENGGNYTGGFGRPLRALALSPFVPQRLTMLVGTERGTDLERLTTLIEAREVTPRVDRSYPLDQAAEAMRHLEAGRVRGKICIAVSS